MKYTDLKINPANPRTIDDNKFDKLKSSVETFTKMLIIRPIAYDSDGVIWGGNMRYLALEDLGIEMKPEYFKELKGFSLEEKREFAIRDNIELGKWADDILASDWSDLPLADWGIVTGQWQDEVDVDGMWDGMPEYDNEDKTAFRTILVHFRNQKDVDSFTKIVNQKITDKTKYIWHPIKLQQDTKSMEFKDDE